MDTLRNIAKFSENILMVATIASVLGLATQPAFAQARADRERCAESVGIQTRHDGRNVWIKRKVSGKTYSAFLRCTDAVAMRHAEATPTRR
ncbi:MULTISPECIES: hypothetical protein [Methylobacterium]|uniref:hypothetical protein n=1 Tax=Methylobacterium TaxID=407 RepID=UPI0013E9C46D|nr:hypothetical protein [Methylobacterium sp. DB0501]NGM36045.1 hypothetical protein [Methylobacterium sp. DB0501]